MEDDSVDISRARRSDGLFDVRALLLGLWRGKWIILLSAVIGFGLGVRKLRNFNPQYEATTIVTPSSGGGAAPQSGGVSQVARSLGVQLPGQQSSNKLFDRLKITIGSTLLARQLDDKYDLMRKVFSSSWISETQHWRKPSGWKFELQERFNRSIHLPTWRPPSIESFANYLKSSIVFKAFKEMAVVRITYANQDPELAREVLTNALFAADMILRIADQKESEFRQSYLHRQLASTSVAEHRSMFLSMIANEERRLMLLQSEKPYALEIVTPIFVSNTPTSPNLIKDFAVLLVGWIIGGFALVMLITLVKEA